MEVSRDIAASQSFDLGSGTNIYVRSVLDHLKPEDLFNYATFHAHGRGAFRLWRLPPSNREIVVISEEHQVRNQLFSNNYADDASNRFVAAFGFDIVVRGRRAQCICLPTEISTAIISPEPATMTAMVSTISFWGLRG